MGTNNQHVSIIRHQTSKGGCVMSAPERMDDDDNKDNDNKDNNNKGNYRWLCRPQRRGIALWSATLGNLPSPGDHDNDLLMIIMIMIRMIMILIRMIIMIVIQGGFFLLF